MNIYLSTGERHCGGCTLCCKVLQVAELNKRKDEWCCHAMKGTGCGIYADRPESCRTFQCVWLAGHLPLQYRPDTIHGVVIASTDGHHLIIHEDPGWPRHASDALRNVIDDFISDGWHYVVVVCGEGRRLIATPGRLAELAVRAQGANTMVTETTGARDASLP